MLGGWFVLGNVDMPAVARVCPCLLAEQEGGSLGRGGQQVDPGENAHRRELPSHAHGSEWRRRTAALASQYLLGQLPPPLLASIISALQVALMLSLQSLHSHLQAQLGVLCSCQLILQFCHLCPQVAGCLFSHPAGSLQLVHLVEKGSEFEAGARIKMVS